MGSKRSHEPRGRLERRRRSSWPGALTACALVAVAPAGARAEGAAGGPGGVLGGGAAPLDAPGFATEQEAPFALPDPSQLRSPRARPVETGEGFAVSALVVEGVTLSELLPVVDALKTDALSEIAAGDGLWRVGDVLALRDAITRAYIAEGYVNSGARVPPQDVTDGRLVIEVIEGRLTDISTRMVTPSALGGVVTEAEHARRASEDPDAPEPPLFAQERAADDARWRPFQLRRSYVEERMTLEGDEPLRVQDLQERFQLLVSDPAIRTVDAALGPGERPGEAELNLRVVETPPFSLSAGFASDRSPAIGGERGSVGFAARNFVGFGDVFSVDAGVSEGLTDVSADYDLPIPSTPVTLHAYVDYSDAEIIEEPLSDNIDIFSTSLNYGLGVSSPLFRGVLGEESASTSYRIGLRGDVARKTSRLELDGVGVGIGPGAGEDGRTELIVGTVALDGLAQSTSRVAAGRVAVNLGLDANDPSANDPFPPPENFVSVLAQAQYAERVFEELDHQIILRADLQYAPETLFTLERFSFGGIDSVRGYRKNEVTTDQAFVGSVEYRASLRPVGRRFDTLFFDDWSLGAFVDGGLGRNAETEDPIDRALLSAGLQLNFDIYDRLGGSFYYGHQIEQVADPEDDMLQDSGFGFRVRLRGL